MKTATDYYQDIAQSLSDFMIHAATLEQKNSELKRVIRTLANSEALDEEGNVTRQLTHQQADFIKRVCEDQNVFHSGGNQ